MADREQIVYRLRAMCRYDDKGEVYIGYIPRLQLYSQARTKERLTQALHSTATQFILACADQKMLFSVLRESGAKVNNFTDHQMREHAKRENVEFVAIADYRECDDLIEVQVPFSALQDSDLVNA